jgi:hypothetical protein
MQFATAEEHAELVRQQRLTLNLLMSTPVRRKLGDEVVDVSSYRGDKELAALACRQAAQVLFEKHADYIQRAACCEGHYLVKAVARHLNGVSWIETAAGSIEERAFERAGSPTEVDRDEAIEKDLRDACVLVLEADSLESALQN